MGPQIGSTWRRARGPVLASGVGRGGPGLVGPIGLGLLSATLWLGTAATAQDEVRSFRKPVLMVETEGHHATVRRLAWPDASSLLSAGLDKVVKVWSLEGEPRLSRTIRPPIWRGPAGIIYALALSPAKDAQGQSALAIAGYGVESTRGDITVVRYPGRPGAAAEPLARLVASREPNAIAHRNSVLCLEFDPTGRLLASGSQDQTAILWDAATFRPLRALRGHQAEVRALAFLPGGQRLVTISGDGSLRLWDAATGAEVGRYQGRIRLNALAVSPDGRAILVGTEQGEIYQFDPADVRAPRFRLPTRPEQGPVEAIAYRPDGRQIAVSLLAAKVDQPVLDSGRIACDVELRDLPAGNVVRTRRLPGLVHACAFSPDGRSLAYAGGHAQAVHVESIADPARAIVELKGKGTTLTEVGFSADGRSVGFARGDAPPLAPEGSVEGFDLENRAATSVPRDQWRRAITALDGWSLQPQGDQGRPRFAHPDGRSWVSDLDLTVERYAWSYTFIPPGPGHPRPTVALGCEAGVIVHDLETGRRTRFFTGHNDAVVSLAPSPDGRWLASSSLDQTVRIYPLAGCDTRPGLGLTLEPAGPEAPLVVAVEPGGFAAGMGLLPGDRILRAAIGRGREGSTYTRPDEIRAFLARADDLPPNLYQSGIWVRRTIVLPRGLGRVTLDLPPVPSTKRNNAALNLVQDVEKEWVLWTPQGFYDTSIEGDTRLLGWHINPPFDQPLPTDYLPVSTYQAAMYRPAVLGQLWTGGDLDRALAAAGTRSEPVEAKVFEAQPPRVVVTAAQPGVEPQPAGTPWKVSVPNPRLRLNLTATGAAAIKAWRAVFDEKLIVRRDLIQPAGAVEEELQLDLPPDRPVRLAVETQNEAGNPRVESIDLVYVPPAPAPKPEPKAPRIVVLAVGAGSFADPALPAIPFAEADARELSGFLGRHLLLPSGERHDAAPAEDRPLLIGPDARADAVLGRFDQLGERIRGGELRPGDLVAVVLASHALKVDGSPFIAAADTTGQAPPQPLISTRDLAERLGELTDYGCRVVLLLDLVHRPEVGWEQSGLKPWVRELQQDRGVIVLVASKGRSSLTDAQAGHGVFALGLLRVFQAGGAVGGVQDRRADYTLQQFRAALVRGVADLSGRQQDAGVFVPRSVRLDSRFASPVASPQP